MRTGLIKPTVVALATALLGITAVVLPAAPAAHADPANKMMLVMDSSGSMKEKLSDGKTRISAAKSALNTVIGGLPGSQQVGLRVYGAKVFDRSDKGACTDSQRVVDLGTDNRDDLKAAVEKYKPYGETPTGYALQQAGKDLGNDGQRTIVLVSDGEPTCAPDPCEVAGDLAEQGIDLKVDVVGLDVSGKARSMLQCVAKAGHGHYYDADSADDIGKALDTVATRSLRPYKPTGKPITGSEQADGAPELTVGDWQDKIGGAKRARSDLFYTLRRTLPGSTFHVSASLTTLDESDGLDLKIIGDTSNCGFATEQHPVQYGQLISVAITAPGYRDWDEKCTENDEFTVEVTRKENDGASRTVPLELRVAEEPPVDNVDSLPKELPDSDYAPPETGPATKIVGGSSFAQATDIKPGSFSGTLVPGEVQIFQLPIEWGQHLTAETRIKPLNQQLDDAMGNGPNWLNVKLFSPSRAMAENVVKSKTQVIVAPDGAEAHAVSYPVAYRNRTSFVTSKSGANRAGVYYIAVGLSPAEGKSYQLPFTLNVGVDGDVVGKPTYLEKGRQPSASPSAGSTPSMSTPTPSASAPTTPDPSPTGNQSGTAVDDSDAKPNPLIRAVGIAAGSVGGLAVLGGIVALIVVLIRRRS
ncbi:VWA domain-containing protein [Microlunatus soli]|uniref:Ca-activated chloride channel family protein n=1 Tax=Microlunatus soli TaxID=630515 RepID=A0A1H1P0Y0_9ACTN|nr:VWA domain-containing protein [Microlunatus soli]SDS04891.1 Ca-activated chloride channel family protein [Microlunatus soli]